MPTRSPRRHPRRSASFVAALVTLSLTATAPIETAGAASVGVVHMTPELEMQIGTMMVEYRRQHGIAGIAVAVVTPDPRGAGPAVTYYVDGVPELGSPTPVDSSTQFELGSETKIFTADLLAFLVALGRVSLDDHVQAYAPDGYVVPEYVDPATGERTPITLGDLATHQAGFPDDPANAERGCPNEAEACENWRPGYTQTLLWEAVGALELPWRPGTNFLYSDFGFGLLGTILSNLLVPDVPMTDPPPFQRALNAAFLDDLGLSSTVLETPDTNPATPYSASGSPTFRWDNTNAFSGGGGLISSAEDMGTMVARHLGYPAPDAPLGVRTMSDTVRPVSTITTACATTAPDSCSPASFQMGLAWQLYGPTTDIPVPTAYKNGGTAGTSTDTLLVPTMGVGVTTMFNRSGVHEQLANSILRLLVASATGPTPAPSTPASESGGAALAESGATASGLLIPLSAAAVMVAIGAIFVTRRRDARRERSGSAAESS